MRETLNERIRNLRREKGLTQLQLSKLLYVTDKAVSKWEVGEGNPDISLLPKLAEIFDVTVDYLLTGVLPTETISLEDMDAEKRGILFTQKDDVENFVKFDYHKKNILINIPTNHSYKETNNEQKMREEIYKLESVKIFELLLDDLIKNRQHEYYYRNSKSPAALIYEDIDNFIKMCAITNRVDGLQFIQFPTFAIGLKTDHKYNNPLKTYLIAEKTLKFIYEDKRVTDEMVSYVSELNFYDESAPIKEKHYYHLNDVIIYYLYKYKKHDLLQRELKRLYENLEEGIKKYHGYRASYSGLEIKVQGTLYTAVIRSGGEKITYFLAVVEPISRALETAITNFDLKWIETFNAFNKKIALELNEAQQYITDKEMEVLKMKANPKISSYEIAVYKNTSLHLLNLEKLFIELMPKGEDVQLYKKLLKDIRNINEKHVKTSYIHYGEMIEDLLNKKNYNALFKFAVDNDLDQLINLLTKKKYKEILRLAQRMFHLDYTDEEVTRWINNYKRSHRSKTHAEVVSTWFSHQYRKDNEYKTNDKYNELILNQFENYEFNKKLTTSFGDFAAMFKNKKVAEVKKELEQKIEEITGEQKAKEEYEKVNVEITEEYLNALIKDSQFETAVIKLSVKLESKLKYLYKYEGDLKEMIDTYIEQDLKLDNLYDDEDNDYYSSRERDRIKTEQTTLLNRLRMVRNSIVHPKSNKEMLSVEELNNLVKMIENMKGVSK